MKEKAKYILLKVVRFIMRVFYAFPVRNNRLFFANYSMPNYTCNTKYITEYLIKTYPGKFDFVWMAAVPEEKRREAGIRTVRQNSFSYFYYLATAKVFISNGGMPTYFPFRESQLTIDTWHGGGAYKRTHAGIDGVSATETERIRTAAKATKLFISSSAMFTEEVIRKSFLYEGEVLECGMPRNDILFGSHPEIAAAVKERYNVPDGTRIILYAPTFRGDWSRPENCGADSAALDVSGCLDAARLRFGGEWRMFYRDHYAVKSESVNGKCVDVSDYPDMQELLLTADILITDYSSSIWDFALTGKPGFLFAADVEKYKFERNFVIPMSEWPYVVTENNAELVRAIEHFDEGSHSEKVRGHLQKLGSFETGTASEAVGEKIHSFCFDTGKKEENR